MFEISPGQPAHFIVNLDHGKPLDQAEQARPEVSVGRVSDLGPSQLRDANVKGDEPGPEIQGLLHSFRKPVIKIGADHRGIQVESKPHALGSRTTQGTSISM